MLDVVNLVTWSITYLLIIFSCKNQKDTPKRAIPLLPVVLNFTWELVALIHSDAFWGHVAWFGLDILVIDSNLMSLSKRKQVIYVLSTIPCAILFSLIFKYGWMLESSFAINLIMSVCFLVEKKHLLKKRKILIATTKFIGTLAATGYYSFSKFVLIVGILVAALDVVYLYCCIMERNEEIQEPLYSPLWSVL